MIFFPPPLISPAVLFKPLGFFFPVHGWGDGEGEAQGPHPAPWVHPGRCQGDAEGAGTPLARSTEPRPPPPVSPELPVPSPIPCPQPHLPPLPGQGVFGGEEKPPPSPPNQGRDPRLWVMGRGPAGIWDLWAQPAPRCHPRTGSQHRESWERAGGEEGGARRISRTSNSFRMGNRWRGAELGGGPWGLRCWEHPGSNRMIPDDSHGSDPAEIPVPHRPYDGCHPPARPGDGTGLAPRGFCSRLWSRGHIGLGDVGGKRRLERGGRGSPRPLAGHERCVSPGQRWVRAPV